MGVWLSTVNIHDLKAAYEKAIGHATSDSTVYNLLHRHGWRKLMPRPFHPKRDFAAQNALLKSTDEVRAKLRQAALYIERNPNLVRSITPSPISSTHSDVETV
jgi:hypothetical protein